MATHTSALHLEGQVGDRKVETGQVSGYGDSVSVRLRPLIQAVFADSLNPRVWTTTVVGTGAVTTVDSMLSVASTALADMADVTGPTVKYRPGFSLLCRFTAMWPDFTTTDHAFVGLSSDQDGLLIGIHEGQPVVVYRSYGSDVMITQLNGDPALLARYDPTSLNTFQIRIPGSGGALKIYAQSPQTDEWLLLHRVPYPNFYTRPIFQYPSFTYRVECHGETSEVRIPSCLVAVEGPDLVARQQLYSTSSDLTLMTGEQILLSVRNDSTTGELLRLADLSVSIDGGRGAVLSIYDSEEPIGAVFTQVDPTSIASRSEVGTLPASPYKMLSRAMAKVSSEDVPLRTFAIDVEPLRCVTITLTTTVVGTDAITGLSWWEDA